MRGFIRRLALGRRRNPLFDREWYLQQNPDVARSGATERHYRRHGASEGRDPSPFIDRDWYLRHVS